MEGGYFINLSNRMTTVYILSDSVGETGELVVRAAISQFCGARFDIKRIHNLNSVEDVQRALNEASRAGAAVIYTLVQPDLKEYLQTKVKTMGIVSVDIMSPVIGAISEVSGLTPGYKPGLLRKIDQDYFSKVEAVEFAVKYDDGKDPKGLLKADLVVIGVSRTSKTPLCMYLAHKGIKVANVPLIPQAPLPKELFELPSQKVVALTIQPAVLQEIRKQRLKTMGLVLDTEYVNMESILAEYEFAMSIANRIGCTVIDVTNKSIEETAAHVIDIYRKGVKESG